MQAHSRILANGPPEMTRLLDGFREPLPKDSNGGGQQGHLLLAEMLCEEDSSQALALLGENDRFRL